MSESPITLADAKKLMEACLRIARNVKEKEYFYSKDDSTIGVLASELMRYYLEYGELPSDLDQK